MDQLLLAYVMLEETKVNREAEATEFKNTMFGHAFLSANPDLYRKIYPEDFGMNIEDELDQIEWAIPASEAEALAMFDAVVSELREPDELDEWRALPLLAEQS